MKTFEEFKEQILSLSKEANACKSQYERAYKSTTFAELFQVIKDNWNYACENGIITGEIIDSVKEEANKCEVWHNESVSCGYMLASGSATVEAWGSATVKAWDSATVKAWDSATVKASGSATVEAWDSATVKAWDSATVRASGSATVRAWDSATVKAWDSAYINVISTMDAKISDYAIMRYGDTDEVVVVKGMMKVRKVDTEGK